MKFHDHKDLVGLHAFLSPSKYYWVGYDDERLKRAYEKRHAAELGTEIHDVARQCITLGIKLPKNKKTLNRYVNDAIGYRMIPEQGLYYSDNCFGTADAISFRDDILRIHDLKTGTSKASMTQLRIYAAIFCLEYGVSPMNIQIHLRIYQDDDVIEDNPDWQDIKDIMDTIFHFDKVINSMKEV